MDVLINGQMDVLINGQIDVLINGQMDVLINGQIDVLMDKYFFFSRSFVHLKHITKDSSTTPPTTSSAGRGGASIKGKKTVTSTLSSDLRVRSESFVTA